MATDWTVHRIGVVRSMVTSPADAPRQGALEGTDAEIVVEPEYAEALAGLDERVGRASGAAARGRIIVLCWMHLADRGKRTVHPRDDAQRPARGVFATRSPHRPNPISLHTVELLEIRGTVLRVRGLDAVDGTPVLDIKPHDPELDG